MISNLLQRIHVHCICARTFARTLCIHLLISLRGCALVLDLDTGKTLVWLLIDSSSHIILVIVFYETAKLTMFTSRSRNPELEVISRNE